MSGLSGIGHSPGMRRLPRPGFAGGSRGCLFVPGLQGSRSRCGSGPAGTLACGGCGRGEGRSVPCRVTVRELAGRTFTSRVYGAPRPAARAFVAPPQGATSGVQPRCTGALHSAPVGVQPTPVPGVPFRDAGKAAASSRPALPPRRASVVSTGNAGTDDAGKVASCAVDVQVVRDNGRLTGHFQRRPEDRNPSSGRPARQGVDPTPESSPTGTPGDFPTRENGFHNRPFQHLQPLVSIPRARQVRAIFTYQPEHGGNPCTT